MIYKDLQQDQKEGKGKGIEINVAFMIEQLRDMIIQPHTSKACHPDQTNRGGWSTQHTRSKEAKAQ